MTNRINNDVVWTNDKDCPMRGSRAEAVVKFSNLDRKGIVLSAERVSKRFSRQTIDHFGESFEPLLGLLGRTVPRPPLRSVLQLPHHLARENDFVNHFVRLISWRISSTTSLSGRTRPAFSSSID